MSGEQKNFRFMGPDADHALDTSDRVVNNSGWSKVVGSIHAQLPSQSEYLGMVSVDFQAGQVHLEDPFFERYGHHVTKAAAFHAYMADARQEFQA